MASQQVPPTWLPKPLFFYNEEVELYAFGFGSHRSIRLLQIAEAHNGAAVKCQLTRWRIDDAPAYDAVSYTWGSPDANVFIEVNGREMNVTPNCEYMLRQNAGRDATWYYWIDAICINQENEAEKSKQVQMMGQIFAGARQVLACVGMHREVDCSEYIFEVLEERRDYFHAAAAEAHDGTKFLSPGFVFRRQLAKWTKWREDELVAETETLSQVSSTSRRGKLDEWVQRFLERPFFRRVWVMQEMCLAKQVIICCGNSRQHIELVHGLCKVLSHEGSLPCRPRAASPAPWDVLLGRPSRYVKMATSPRFGYQTAQLRMVDLACSHAQSMAMEDLIMKMDGLLSQDARDTIYGIVSLADWRLSAPIRVDYGMSRCALAMHVIYSFHWDRPEISRTNERQRVRVMQKLVQNLQLSRDDESVNRVLEIRRNDPEMSPLLYLHNELASVGQDSCIHILCRGSKIVFSGADIMLEGIPKMYEEPIFLRREPEEELEERMTSEFPSPAVRFFQGRLPEQGTLCPGAEHGDWLLSAGGDTDIAVIVRASRTATGRFEIIGQALLDLDAVDRVLEHGKAFDTFWHRDDLFLMVMQARHRSEWSMGHTVTTDLLRLSYPVCRKAGSPYATINDV